MLGILSTKERLRENPSILIGAWDKHANCKQTNIYIPTPEIYIQISKMNSWERKNLCKQGLAELFISSSKFPVLELEE